MQSDVVCSSERENDKAKSKVTAPKEPRQTALAIPVEYTTSSAMLTTKAAAPHPPSSHVIATAATKSTREMGFSSNVTVLPCSSSISESSERVQFEAEAVVAVEGVMAEVGAEERKKAARREQYKRRPSSVRGEVRHCPKNDI